MVYYLAQLKVVFAVGLLTAPEAEAQVSITANDVAAWPSASYLVASAGDTVAGEVSIEIGENAVWDFSTISLGDTERVAYRAPTAAELSHFSEATLVETKVRCDQMGCYDDTSAMAYAVNVDSMTNLAVYRITTDNEIVDIQLTALFDRRIVFPLSYGYSDSIYLDDGGVWIIAVDECNAYGTILLPDGPSVQAIGRRIRLTFELISTTVDVYYYIWYSRELGIVAEIRGTSEAGSASWFDAGNVYELTDFLANTGGNEVRVMLSSGTSALTDRRRTSVRLQDGTSVTRASRDNAYDLLGRRMERPTVRAMLKGPVLLGRPGCF